MPRLIETPEQELQHMIGHLIWENTALRHQVESLRRQLAEQRQGETAQQPKPEEAPE